MNNEFKLYNKVRITNNFLFKIVTNFPRKEKIIKDKIIENCLNLVNYCNAYNISSKKEYKLKMIFNILVVVADLNYYFELAYDRKYISLNQARKISTFLSEMRQMSYGLINYLKNKYEDRD